MEDEDFRLMTRYPDFSAIRAEMKKRGFRFTRRWGQNFLTNRSLLDFIVSEAALGPGDLVLEMGTGPGCLTGYLRPGPPRRCTPWTPAPTCPPDTA